MQKSMMRPLSQISLLVTALVLGGCTAHELRVEADHQILVVDQSRFEIQVRDEQELFIYPVSLSSVSFMQNRVLGAVYEKAKLDTGYEFGKSLEVTFDALFDARSIRRVKEGNGVILFELQPSATDVPIWIVTFEAYTDTLEYLYTGDSCYATSLYEQLQSGKSMQLEACKPDGKGSAALPKSDWSPKMLLLHHIVDRTSWHPYT